MKLKKFKLITVFILILGLTGVHAQQAITTAGSEATGDGGTISYSVGQIAYKTITGTNGTITEGVQQPLEIFTVGIDNSEENLVDITAFPNPVTNNLLLKIDPSLSFQSMEYQLYNMQGNLLKNNKLTGNETDIDLSSLVPSSYFLRVIEKEKEIKTFIIIKN